MLSTNEQIAKLRELLARVQANAAGEGARLEFRWPGQVWQGPTLAAHPVLAGGAAAPTPAAPAPIAATPVAATPIAATPVAAKGIVAPTPVPAVVAAKPAVPAKPPVPVARPKAPSRTDEAALAIPVAAAALVAPLAMRATLDEDATTTVASRPSPEVRASQDPALAARTSDAGSTGATVSAAVTFGAPNAEREPRVAQLEPVMLKTTLPDEPEVARFIGLPAATGADSFGDLLTDALSF